MVGALVLHFCDSLRSRLCCQLSRRLFGHCSCVVNNYKCNQFQCSNQILYSPFVVEYTKHKMFGYIFSKSKHSREPFSLTHYSRGAHRGRRSRDTDLLGGGRKTLRKETINIWMRIIELMKIVLSDQQVVYFMILLIYSVLKLNFRIAHQILPTI